MRRRPTQGFAPLQVAQLLYDEDVLSEEGLFQWEGEKRYADESDKKYLNQCKTFLTVSGPDLISWVRFLSTDSALEQ